MIAALAIPRFAFAVVSRRLGLRDASTAAALAPEPGGPPRMGEPSAAAEAAGVRPGMRLSEALALCPQLALLPPDPIAVEEATELLYARLEDLGLPLEPAGPGRALLATGPVERLYGGRAAVLVRLQDAAPGARIGAAPGRFPALAATRRARAGRPLSVPRAGGARVPRAAGDRGAGRGRRHRSRLVEALCRSASTGWAGSRRSTGCRCATGSAPPAHAWRLASGDDPARLVPARCRRLLRETLVLPDAAVTEGALDHALRVLVERLLQRPDRAAASRARCASAPARRRRLVERTAPLREPTADPARIRLALHAKLRAAPRAGRGADGRDRGVRAGQPAVPAVPRGGRGARRAARRAPSARCARRSATRGALHIVEVDEASRLPERRFGLAPR